MLPSLITGSTPFKNRFSDPPILINPDGLGDFKTITEAIAESDAGTHFLIDGVIAETALTISKDCFLWGLPGHQILAPVTITGGVVEFHNLNIDSVNSSFRILADAVDVEFYAYDSKIISDDALGLFLQSDNGASIVCEVYGDSLIYSGDGGGPVGMRIQGNEAASVIVKMMAGVEIAIVQGVFGTGLSISSTAFDAVNSYIQGIKITGDFNSIDSTPVISPEIYLCLLKGTVGANVTLPAGGNNVVI